MKIATKFGFKIKKENQTISSNYMWHENFLYHTGTDLVIQRSV